MNKQQIKIKKLIKEKEKQLVKLEKAKKNIGKKHLNNIKEDFKFLNTINPFYKKKYNFKKDMTRSLFLVTQQVRLESEIKELKKLL